MSCRGVFSQPLARSSLSAGGGMAMWMRSGVVILIAAVGLAGAAAQDGSLVEVLARQRPLNIHWGEIALAETDDVAIRPHESEGEKLYPHALSLTFTMRGREVAPSGQSDGAGLARSKSEAYGEILVAGDFNDGSRAWDVFSDRALELAARPSPAGWPEFFSGFTGRLGFQDCGSFSLLVCLSIGDSADQARRINVGIERKDDEIREMTQASETLVDPVPTCSALRRAMQYLQPRDVVVSDFQLEESEEERVSLVAVDRSDQPPASLPEGGRIERMESPSGAGASRSMHRSGDVVRTEEVLPAEGEGAPTVISVKVRPSSVSQHMVEGSCLLQRWRLERKRRLLGPAPAVSGELDETLVAGYFFTAPPGTVQFDRVQEAVAQDLNALDGPLDLAALMKSVQVNISLLGPLSGFSVYCPQKEDPLVVATYCIGQACSIIEEPEALCRAISDLVPQAR